MRPSYDLRPTFMCCHRTTVFKCVCKNEWQIEFRKSVFIHISSVLSLFDANNCAVYTFEHTFFIVHLFLHDLICFKVLVNEKSIIYRIHHFCHTIEQFIMAWLVAMNWTVFLYPQSMKFSIFAKHFLSVFHFAFYRQRLDGQILPNWRRWRCVSSNKSTHNINC